MEKIYNNLSIENLTKTKWFNQFDEEQQKEILKGLENNVDVSVYAKSKFSWFQMLQIRSGLEENLDVSVYANSKYNWRQMEEIRWGLENNIKVSIYAKPKVNWKQMQKIREKLLKEKEDKENEQNTQ